MGCFFFLGAIGGLAHQPMQALMNDGLTAKSVVGGVGKGLVGIVTKPIGGAADLLVHTGQGLLQVNFSFKYCMCTYTQLDNQLQLSNFIQ